MKKCQRIWKKWLLKTKLGAKLRRLPVAKPKRKPLSPTKSVRRSSVFIKLSSSSFREMISTKRRTSRKQLNFTPRRLRRTLLKLCTTVTWLQFTLKRRNLMRLSSSANWELPLPKKAHMTSRSWLKLLPERLLLLRREETVN
jgi:hypothetical protein